MRSASLCVIVEMPVLRAENHGPLKTDVIGRAWYDSGYMLLLKKGGSRQRASLWICSKFSISMVRT
jgi:hypothetical protein